MEWVVVSTKTTTWQRNQFRQYGLFSGWDESVLVDCRSLGTEYGSASVRPGQKTSDGIV